MRKGAGSYRFSILIRLFLIALLLRKFHNGLRKFQPMAITGCLHFQDAGETNAASCIGVENVSRLPVAETPYGIHHS